MNPLIDSKPSLRFPKFEDSWTKVKLDSVVKVNQGLAILTKNRFSKNGPNRFKYITIPFLLGGDCQFIENPSPSVICNVNDIFVTRTGSGMGRIWTGVHGVFHNNFFKVVPIDKKVIIKFMYYFLNKPLIQNLMKRYAGVGAIPDLNHGEFYLLPFFLPLIPEQQKIADFLSTVDKKIQTLTKKKELLESYKKGVMQQIFKQEIRFRKEDGSDYPEWEEKRFEELYKFVRTNSYSRDKLNYTAGAIYNIHYGDIHTKFKSRFELNDEVVPFINSVVDISRYAKEDYLEKGDLVIADASEDYNDIGKTIEVVNIGGKKVLAGLHTFLAKLKSNKIVVGFISHYVMSWDYRYQVMRIAQGTKVLSISKSRLSELKLKLPCTKEQTKIANFLTAIDDKINVVARQIDKMKDWKKGLLQQMFV